MDVIKLSDEIISHPEHIETILEALGHTKITDRGRYYQTSNLDGDNNTAISILKENLVYKNFTRNSTGNIFTLVQEEKNCDFKTSLRFVSKTIKFSDEPFCRFIKPFGGFYEKIIKYQSDEIIQLPEYLESDLPSPDSLPYSWFKDGVSFCSMTRMGIRYCHDTDEIIIPWRDYSGRIIGAKSRSNDPNVPMDKRWNMYLKFSTSQCVYGWYENYHHIQRKRKVIIAEAEKSVGQGYTMNCKSLVAIGGHNISKTQIKLLQKLMADEYIVAFDEGISEEEIRYEAAKLKTDNPFLNSKVSYLFDTNRQVLKDGSKNSPTDVGIDGFKQLLKERIYI